MSLTRFKLSLAASMAMAAMAMTGVAAPGPSRGRSHPMRERKRLAARAAGGWVSSDAWLAR